MSDYSPLPSPSRPWIRAHHYLRQQPNNINSDGMGVQSRQPYPHYQQRQSHHATTSTSYSMATSKEARLESFVPRIAGQSEMDGCVQVWRMPKDLSQSRLGDRTQSSNACTIIALKIAEQLYRQCVFFPSNDHRFAFPNTRAQEFTAFRTASGTRTPLMPVQQQIYRPYSGGRYAAGEDEWGGEMARASSLLQPVVETARLALVSALTNAIVDGNVIHEWNVRLRSNGEQNFTIPDAIAACQHIFREIDFCTVVGPIWRNLATYIRRALGRLSKNRAQVFLMVIAYERSILLVYQPHNCTIGVADSHSHGFDEGAMLACASIFRLDEFCLWMAQNVFPECAYTPDATQEFEISAIQFIGRAESDYCASSTETSPPLTVIDQRRIFQAPMTSAGKHLGKRQPSSPTQPWSATSVKHFKPEAKEQSSKNHRRRFH